MKKHRIKTTEYKYVISPYEEPIAYVKSGDVLEIETEDAFAGKLDREDKNPETVIPFFNPLTGPIYIDGARTGDTLKVTIHGIEPLRDWGVSSIQGHFGALGGTHTTRILNEPLKNQVFLYRLEGDEYVYNDRLRFSYEPFIGTIATAPAIEAVSALTPFAQGGNMDVPDVKPGNVIYLPIQKDGAYLYVGDCHARQGQGEACGTALEIAAKVTLTAEVVRGKNIKWPRIENDREMMCIGSARPMEDAARIACCEMIEWMQEFGWTSEEAYQAFTMDAGLYIGNMVDSAYSVVAKMKKETVARGGGMWKNE